MAVTLVRVDDRIIHGQTTTRWTKARDVFGIIVVGDNVAKDELRKKVLKAAAGNYKLGIYNEEVGVEKIAQAFAAPKNYFIIAESPVVFANLVEKGVDLGSEINIGPMNAKPGAKNLGNTTSLDENDYKAFEYLNDQGYHLSFQIIPSEKPRTWDQVKNKYNSIESV